MCVFSSLQSEKNRLARQSVDKEQERQMSKVCKEIQVISKGKESEQVNKKE